MRTISLRSSYSSSRISLLSSTTSKGSMNTVLPVADSSRTMPLSLRLFDAETGITIRPSRIDVDASESTNPSACACFRIEPIRLATEACFDEISLLILANSGDALSLILPNRLRMESIRSEIKGKYSTSLANLARLGYLGLSPFVKNERIDLMASSERLRLNSSASSNHDPSCFIRSRKGVVSA